MACRDWLGGGIYNSAYKKRELAKFYMLEKVRHLGVKATLTH